MSSGVSLTDLTAGCETAINKTALQLELQNPALGVHKYPEFVRYQDTDDATEQLKDSLSLSMSLLSECSHHLAAAAHCIAAR